MAGEARTRLRLLCVTAAALACGGSTLGGQSVTVERVGSMEVPADAGGRVIVAFRIVSRAATDIQVATTVGLPPAWQLVVPDSGLTVAARATELQLIPISIPSNARAGAYVVRYAGTHGAEPAARDSVVVTIAERRQLQATVSDAPAFVGAGDSYRAGFLIRNTGNAPAAVRVAVTGDHDVDVKLDTADFRIEPGDERLVSAAIQTSAKAPRKTMQRVGIVATPVGDTLGRISVASAVEVIPRRPRDVSTRMGLPVLLGLAKSDAGSLAPELSGGGFLTRGRTVQVDFLARPSAPGDLMAPQDEYWLGLSNGNRFRLRLGDQSYNRTRLTQSVRPGMGASGELSIGPLVFGGQGLSDRRSFARTKEREYGGTLDLRLFGDRSRVGTGFLSRSGVDAADVWLGQGFAQLPGHNLLRLEYGAGDGNAGRGTAYIASVNGAARILSYGMHREAADTSFPGIGAGVTYTDLNARLRATKQIALVASAAERTRQPSGSAPRGTFYRELEAGVNLGPLFSLNYRRTRDTGLVSVPARTGQSGRARLRVPISPRASIGGNFEHGFSVFDGVAGARAPFNQVGAEASLSIAGQRLSASVDRLKGTPVYGAFDIDQTAAQFSADIQLGPTTRLNIGLSANRSGGARGGTSSILDIGFDQRLARGQQARWQGQSFTSAAGAAPWQSRHRAQYLIPLSAPLPGDDESGWVDLRLVDENAKPIANTLVRLGGDARLTDAMGRARFTGLVPGQYQVDVDRARIGAGRIVSPSLPLSLEVGRGEKRSLELRFTRAAQLIGVVQRMDFLENRRLGAPDTIIDAGGHSGVRLQLTNNGDTLRTVSNGGGRFRFGDLRAGHWELTVLPTGMPPQHRAEQEHVGIDVAAGAAEEVLVRIIPVKQSVVFIADVDLGPERPPAPIVTPAPSATPSIHVVASNDTSLLQVARKVYGDGELWPKVWLANRRRLGRPELMHVGDTLVIPPKAPLTRAEIAARESYLRRPTLPRGWPRADESWRPPVVRHYYTVTRHDGGLAAIARAMYGTSALWPKIWLANLDVLASPDALRPGQRLRIPEAGALTRSEVAARDAYLKSRR